MNNLENLNQSIKSLEKILEVDENNIDPEILRQLEEVFCNIEYNFSNVEEELTELKNKLVETENELNKRKEIIWNNKDLRGQIISSAFRVVNY